MSKLPKPTQEQIDCINNYYKSSFVGQCKHKVEGRFSDLCKVHGVRLINCMYCRGFQGQEEV